MIHPEYKSKMGLRNFERTLKLYSTKPYVDIKQSFETGKQRKSAVAELMRFICSREFPVVLKERYSRDSDMYTTAHSLLLNGEVSQAVRLLSKNGKHDISLLVSQSVSAQGTFKGNVKNMIGEKFQNSSPELLAILNLISADDPNELLNNSRDLKWQQALCCMLLFVAAPQMSLIEVVGWLA